MRNTMLVALCAAIAGIGCGGSGHEAAPSTRQAIKRAIGRFVGLSRAEDNGLSRSSLARERGLTRSMPQVRRKAAPGRGEDYGNESYYDPSFELWRIDVSDDNVDRTTFWLEEAATTPAGTQTVTYPTSDAYPWTITTVYQITAGSGAGSHGASSDVQDSETVRRSSFDFYSVVNGANAGRLYGSDSYGPDHASAWSVTVSAPDGAFYHVEGSFNGDGVGTETVSTSAATVSANYASNGSGNGTVTVPEGSRTVFTQSATFEWTPEGVVTIHYADGTSETIQP